MQLYNIMITKRGFKMAKYGTIRELQAHATNLISSTDDGEPLIITTRGKPVAVLAAVTPDEADSVAKFMEKMRSYQAFKNLQKQARNQSVQKPSQKEIDNIIKNVRKSHD